MNPSVSTSALAVLLIASMLTVGSGIDREAFERLRRRPRPLFVALLLNLVLVPAVAVIGVNLAGLEGPIAMGVVLAAAAPGGGTGSLLAHHARGDLALSVSLQGMLAVAGLISVPAWVAVSDVGSLTGTGTSVGLVAGLLALQLVPFCFGVSLRSRAPERAARVQGIARRVADVLLVAVVAWYAVTAGGRISELPGAALLIIFVVVLASLASYWAPALDGAAQRRGVAMTTAVRSLTLALFLAGLQPDADGTSLAILTYGLFMYVLASAAIPVMRGTTQASYPHPTK
jgi:bile acid:Na+ symporter, BASS family